MVGMPKRINKSSKSRKQRGGAGMLGALAPLAQQPALPGGLSSVLPTDSWGRWAETPESYQASPNTSLPAPLANGGLYTNPQSTAPWASSPFPATQHALALEAAATSGLPEVAYHQRPNDNFGASFSPYVASPITSQHSSASGPAGPFMKGGQQSRRRQQSRNQRKQRQQRQSQQSRRKQSMNQRK